MNASRPRSTGTTVARGNSSRQSPTIASGSRAFPEAGVRAWCWMSETRSPHQGRGLHHGLRRGLRRLEDTLWEIPREARPDMRVPARVFADRELVEAISEDRSLE